jgi:hypothetical protein
MLATPDPAISVSFPLFAVSVFVNVFPVAVKFALPVSVKFSTFAGST